MPKRKLIVESNFTYKQTKKKELLEQLKMRDHYINELEHHLTTLEKKLSVFKNMAFSLRYLYLLETSDFIQDEMAQKKTKQELEKIGFDNSVFEEDEDDVEAGFEDLPPIITMVDPEDVPKPKKQKKGENIAYQ